MPNAAYSGTALATAPCELADMSSAPVRSAVTIAASSPSCADGATWTSMRPLVLALTTSANFTRRLVARVARRGAVAERELGRLRLRGEGRRGGGGQREQGADEGLALHGLSPGVWMLSAQGQ